MKSAREKMLAGDLYDAADVELTAARLRAGLLCQKLDALPFAAVEARARLLAELFATATPVAVTPPFRCDYGVNIRLGANVYFNFNCVVLDVALVTIGSNVLFGPGVQLYTATHPLSAAARRSGLESGRPITIGDDVWVGGASVVCPGVRIGAASVIGAGSVVTRDVPANVLAVGNPCRVIRHLAPQGDGIAGIVSHHSEVGDDS